MSKGIAKAIAETVWGKPAFKPKEFIVVGVDQEDDVNRWNDDEKPTAEEQWYGVSSTTQPEAVKHGERVNAVKEFTVVSSNFQPTETWEEEVRTPSELWYGDYN